MEKDKIVSLVKNNRKLIKAATNILNRLNIKNRFHHVSKGELSIGVSILNGITINNRGKNNTISIGDFCRIKGSTINIFGNNNHIIISDYVCMNDVELYMEDDSNNIEIGSHTSLCGKAHLATIEGTSIYIGENCLFASELQFRTGDSHSILDMDGKRINRSEDINIGNHVWIGARSVCLKGTTIANNCIVGTTTTLCKNYDTENCVIAGVPGKIVKKDVNWCSERIEMNN